MTELTWFPLKAMITLFRLTHSLKKSDIIDVHFRRNSEDWKHDHLINPNPHSEHVPCFEEVTKGELGYYHPRWYVDISWQEVYTQPRASLACLCYKCKIVSHTCTCLYTWPLRTTWCFEVMAYCMAGGALCRQVPDSGADFNKCWDNNGPSQLQNSLPTTRQSCRCTKQLRHATSRVRWKRTCYQSKVKISPQLHVKYRRVKSKNGSYLYWTWSSEGIFYRNFYQWELFD
jgi:hypothetical protein